LLQQDQRNFAGADFTVGVVDTAIGVDGLICGRAIAESDCRSHIDLSSQLLPQPGVGPGSSHRHRRFFYPTHRRSVTLSYTNAFKREVFDDLAVTTVLGRAGEPHEVAELI